MRPRVLRDHLFNKQQPGTLWRRVTDGLEKRCRLWVAKDVDDFHQHVRVAARQWILEEVSGLKVDSVGSQFTKPLKLLAATRITHLALWVRFRELHTAASAAADIGDGPKPCEIVSGDDAVDLTARLRSHGRIEHGSGIRILRQVAIETLGEDLFCRNACGAHAVHRGALGVPERLGSKHTYKGPQRLWVIGLQQQ
jgi:hypothetical protein